jgi:hypothetical protein
MRAGLLHKSTSPLRALTCRLISPLFPCPSHMLNSMGLLLYCMPTPKLVIYVNVKGTPPHYQTLLIKVSVRFESLAPAGVAPWPRGLQPHSWLPCKNAELLCRPPISSIIYPSTFTGWAKEGEGVVWLCYEMSGTRVKSILSIHTRALDARPRLVLVSR